MSRPPDVARGGPEEPPRTTPSPEPDAAAKQRGSGLILSRSADTIGQSSRPALELAAAGWRVHPCREHDIGEHKGKSPYLTHGHLDASSDPDLIRRWWARWPAALIGVAVPDNLVIFDVDPRNGGSIEALIEALGPLPATLTAWSGRGDGGRHLYFLRPTGPLSSRLLPAGVDRKVSGYVIAPPSLHPATGQPYWWEHRPVAGLPRQAQDALRPPVRIGRPAAAPVSTSGRARQAIALVRAVQTAPDGRRNDTLFWAARRALAEGHHDAVVDQLGEAALAAGLPAGEAARTIASARGAHTQAGTR